ncbi:pilus assembly protein [Crocosphaera sp. Alani8]|uniref:pilus assembly protein n=1 Tax=Crocosphaera sp. Alani8 TaxID=3038952 RepID=UPI00313E4208
MTFSEEFNSAQSEEDFEEQSSNYPSAFGITFTPQISGICLGVLGIIGSIYVGLTLVKPAYDNYNQLKTTEAEKQGQVVQQETGEFSQQMLEAEGKLRESESLRNQVLSLFSSEESLKTILLDINQLVEKHQAELVSFQPDGTITIVKDSSLGAGVNNRLKRQKFNLTIKGNFGSTQSILRDLERLQPLLVITGLSSQLVDENFIIDVVNVTQDGGKVQARGQDTLETSFTLDAILPLSPEELARLTAEEASEEGEQAEQ